MKYKCSASVNGFLFLFSLAIFFMAGLSLSAHAHHNPGHAGGPGDGGDGGTGGTTAVTTVIVDYSLGEIRITGADLSPAAVSIGGVAVTTSTDTPTDVVVDFNATTAGIVTETGNYALDINGASSLVYFSEPILDPTVPASCPCEADWSDYLSRNVYADPPGYSGLGAECTYLSPSEDEAVVYITEQDPVLFIPLHWIMYSRYTNDFKQCAQYLDGLPKALDSLAEHSACVTYLNDNHILGLPGANPPCEYPADLPVPLPWP